MQRKCDVALCNRILVEADCAHDGIEIDRGKTLQAVIGNILLGPCLQITPAQQLIGCDRATGSGRTTGGSKRHLTRGRIACLQDERTTRLFSRGEIDTRHKRSKIDCSCIKRGIATSQRLARKRERAACGQIEIAVRGCVCGEVAGCRGERVAG